MLITQSSLDALFIGFNKMFDDAMLKAPPSAADTVATITTSNTRDTRYPFAQMLSGPMREWIGSRQVQNLKVDAITITNQHWESTLEIDADDIADDQFQVYAQSTINSLAINAKALPDQKIKAAINANALTYDGKAFFATDHYVDPDAQTGTQANKFTSKPLNATNLAIVKAAMRNFQGPGGIPLGVNPDVLMVPSSLEFTAAALANSAFYPINTLSSSGTGAGPVSNPLLGQFKVVVNPYLDDTNDPSTAVWYLLDTSSRGFRPFIWQQRSAPQFVSLINPNDSNVFNERMFRYGVDFRGAAALGLWFLASQVSGA